MGLLDGMILALGDLSIEKLVESSVSFPFLPIHYIEVKTNSWILDSSSVLFPPHQSLHSMKKCILLILVQY